jgi:hypothetical protein
VANIQIYLHAKFHIFLSPLSISTNVIPTSLKDQTRKRKLNWKKGLSHFLRASPALQCLPSQSHAQAARYHFPCRGHSHMGPTYRCRLFPQIPSSAPACHWWHRFRPLPPPSHHLELAVAACYPAYAHRWVILSPHSTRRHVTLLHRSTAVKAAAPPRCQRQAPGDKASRSVSASSSLAGTTCGPSILQLPSPAPGRNHAVAHPCAPRGHHQPLPVQLTTPTPAYGENSHPSRALHGAIVAVLPPMLPHLSSDCAGI